VAFPFLPQPLLRTLVSHLTLTSPSLIRFLLSRACFYHIRDLRRIRPVLDFSTEHAIGTSLIHSRLDYCNSLYLNLPKTQLHRLQQIHNSLARAVVAAPRSCPADHILKSLHWLKVPERIEYKIISTTYISFSSFQVHSTFMMPPPYSLHVLLGHQTWSLSTIRQFSHVSGWLTILFGILHLSCGTNLLIPFGSLISLVHLSAPLCPQAPTPNLPSTCLMVCSILGSRPISFPP